MTIWPHISEYVDYPTSDGEPMGETDIHRDLMVDLIESLKHHYREQSDVYVSGNIMFYYEEGVPQSHLSPDVLITPGVSNEPKEVYKLWQVGKAPELVIEVTSRSTRLRDVGVKKGLYEAIGVQEYLLFDPRSEYLRPRFQVFRLQDELYVPCLAPESSGYESRLGLTFRVVDGTLKIFDTATGRALCTPRDLARLAEAATVQAEAESQRAEAESQRAEAESQRAERLAQQLRKLGVEPQP